VEDGVTSAQIPRSFGSIALVALLMGAGVPTNIARANDCLTAPNSAAPQGSHWYYRLDWATQRKCWYVRAFGEPVQRAALPATTGLATPSKPKPAADGAPISVSPADTGPPLPHEKMRAVKPDAAPVTTTDDITSSIPEVSAPQAKTSSESSAQADTPAHNAAPISATTDMFVQRAQEGNTASPVPEISTPQVSSSSEISAQATASAPGAPVAWPNVGVAVSTVMARESITVPTDASADTASDDLARTAQGGELTDNAGMPLIISLYLALGLALVGVLSFAVPKLLKNETNKMRASADLNEIAASIARRLARSRDGGAESGDLQQADAFVLNEANCACDGERLDESAAPKQVAPQMSPLHMKPTSDEYWAKADACLNWAREAPTDEVRLGCLTLAQTWLKAAMRNGGDAPATLPLAPTLSGSVEATHRLTHQR